MAARIVLFGATGYTGRLTAEAMVERGLEPVLAARSQSKLDALAADLSGDLETRTADVSDPSTVAALVEHGDGGSGRAFVEHFKASCIFRARRIARHAISFGRRRERTMPQIIAGQKGAFGDSARLAVAVVHWYLPGIWPKNPKNRKNSAPACRAASPTAMLPRSPRRAA